MERYVVRPHKRAWIHSCHRVFLVAGVTVILVGSTAAVKASELQVSITEAETRSLGIRVVHPIPSIVDQTLPFPAQVVIPTAQLWAVNAPIAGMVETLLVARGDRVARGQTIATLQSSNFVSLQREYLHAVEQEVLANQQLRRNTILANVQALAQRLLEASETEARQASVAVAERRQMLKLSGMSDEQITRLNSEASITATLAVKAPETGTVIEVAISPGMRLDQAAPMLKVARMSPLWIEIAVPAASVQVVRSGAPVTLEGYQTPGHVLLVSETTDPATQTVLVRAEIANDGQLRPGQTVAARINFVSAAGRAWEIPYPALARRGETASVFAAVPGGFRVVPVTVLAEDVDHVVVAGSISDSDEVAISGVSALRGILLGLGAGR